MASVAELTAILARVDTATTKIADDIRRIKDQIVGGLTAAEAQAIQDQAEALAVKLEALDAENPEGNVPPVE